MDPNTVGIVSPGEMGSSIARVVADHGLHPLTTLAGRSCRTRENAVEAGMEDVGSTTELVRQSDVVLSIVPSDVAFDVATDVADAAREIGDRILFVELNAIAFSTAEEIAVTVGDDVDVVDGCIFGPASDLSRATFYFAGPRADDAASLGAYGLNTTVLGDRIGQASGLKLCYSGMTKGTAVLAMDLLLAAHALGLSEPLWDLYQESLPGIAAFAEYTLPGTPKRSGRRSAEMDELVTQLESVDLDGSMARAIRDRLAWIASQELDTDDAPTAVEASRRVFDAAFENAE